jgi:ABC-2 type transport system permease protein
MKNLQTSIKRELGRIKARPRYLLLMTAGIVFSYVFFMTLMGEGQPERLPIAIVDQDGSYVSRQLCHEINATQGVEVVAVYNQHQEAREAMQRQEIYAFLEIPANTYSEILSFKAPHLVLYSNNAYLLPGSLSYKTLSTVCKLASGAMQREILRKKGCSEEQIMGIIQPIELDTHLIGNPWASYQPYILTTILPGIVGLMALLLSVFVIGQEYKDGTTRDWLLAANGDIMSAVAGKMLPYTLWFFLLGLIGNIVMFGPCHYTMEGSFLALTVTLLLFIIALQSMAVLLAGLLPDQHISVCIAAIYGALSFSMSGFSYPVSNMPPALQAFSYLFPLRHYYLVYADVSLFGSTLHQYYPHLCMLILFLLPGLIGCKLISAKASSMRHDSGQEAAALEEQTR